MEHEIHLNSISYKRNTIVLVNAWMIYPFTRNGLQIGNHVAIELFFTRQKKNVYFFVFTINGG